MGYWDIMTGGDAKYYYIMQYVFVGSCIGFFFINPWTVVLLILMEIFAFQYFMVRKDANLIRKHQGERHCDTFTVREKEHREDKIYSFRDHEELVLFTESSKNIEKTQEYQDTLVFVLDLRRKQRAHLAEQIKAPVEQLEEHIGFIVKEATKTEPTKIESNPVPNEIENQTHTEPKVPEVPKELSQEEPAKSVTIIKRKEKKPEEIENVSKEKTAKSTNK